MTSKMPTDPLADASTGAVRRSRGAFIKTVPERRERRDSKRANNYTGPERRRPESQTEGAPVEKHRLLFGQPRWLVIAAGVYVAALAVAMILIFTY